jgi:hypothetical protein
MHGHYSNTLGALLNYGGFIDLATFGIRFEPFDKGAEGGGALFEMPRQVDQALAVGQSLLACGPESDAGMRAHGFEQHGDSLGNRAMVAPDVKPSEEGESVGNLDCSRIQRGAVDRVHRMQAAGGQRAVAVDILPKGKERLVAEREERSPEGGKDFQLIIGPFDRG